MTEREFEYYVNLNERGSFYADVRLEGETVFEIEGFDIFYEDWMRHTKDTEGLQEYLVSLGIMNAQDFLSCAN